MSYYLFIYLLFIYFYYLFWLFIFIIYYYYSIFYPFRIKLSLQKTWISSVVLQFGELHLPHRFQKAESYAAMQWSPHSQKVHTQRSTLHCRCLLCVEPVLGQHHQAQGRTSKLEIERLSLAGWLHSLEGPDPSGLASIEPAGRVRYLIYSELRSGRISAILDITCHRNY